MFDEGYLNDGSESPNSLLKSLSSFFDEFEATLAQKALLYKIHY